MTTAERLIRRGIWTGMRKGMQKGKLEGKLDDARRMLMKGIDLAMVLEITELTEEILRDNGVLES
ncbi:hypothetical protein LEP1GSC058_2842 [Leptospira fainei serovar Hurstbridge str. BUT 6]|uniref:Transposase n=2 Tax=Leptospira fainei TaxID=48782 RepID=S3W1J0_9LEPT|nr:hypothetical protein LEP1GSC058_2842 [Leptospira fainei serovar Hurstbridge str. BUT 6]